MSSSRPPNPSTACPAPQDPKPDEPRARVPGWAKRLYAGASGLIRRPRFLLAVKAALAAAIAWSVALLLPAPLNNYPYYAPLGALISMYPTLMGSVKQSLGTLVGLVMGILLAWCFLVLADPNVLTLALVVGIGVLLGGITRLGAGRDYVAPAALFVLIIGGQNAGPYSMGYLVHMVLGVAVGLLVNLLIFPPLHFNAAVLQLSGLRGTLASHLEDMAAALTEHWPPEHEDWASRAGRLAEAADGVRQAVNVADESRKGNPRAKLHRRDLDEDYDDVHALERITFHIRDTTEILAGVVWGKPFPAELPVQLHGYLSAALAAVAALLRSWNSRVEQDERLDEAYAALRILTEVIDRGRSTGATSFGAAASILMNLSRIVEVIRPRLGEP